MQTDLDRLKYIINPCPGFLLTRDQLEEAQDLVECLVAEAVQMREEIRALKDEVFILANQAGYNIAAYEELAQARVALEDIANRKPVLIDGKEWSMQTGDAVKIAETFLQNHEPPHD